MNTVTNSDREKLLRLINGDEVVIASKSGSEKPAGAPKGFLPFFEFHFTLRNKVLLAVLCVEIAYAIIAFAGGVMQKRMTTAVSASSGTDAFKLIGVDWSQDPVAMIEDAQDNKTYFLKKNGRIKDFKVIEVLKESVRVSRGAQTLEIR